MPQFGTHSADGDQRVAGMKGFSVGAQVLEQAREVFVEDTPPEELGWILWLTPEHRRLFKEELFDAVRAQRPETEIGELLLSWIATAELDHSPQTQKEIARNRASARFASVDEWLRKQSGTK